MCLILFAFDELATTPLALGANRDEFFHRPSASAHYWQTHPEILAGQDLVGGGTWLGITRSGRFAAVTNIREPGRVVENPLSRGELTRNFLIGSDSPETYLSKLESQKMLYSGFNLLVGDFSPSQKQLWYLSNRQTGITRLSSGTYGLSNHLLDTDWPKVKAGKQYLQEMLSTPQGLNDIHTCFRHFLENHTPAEDEQLPQTGVSYDREKALSAAFIALPDYGTRTSTVLTISDEKLTFSEKNYLPDTKAMNSTYELFDIQRDQRPQALSTA